MTTPTPPGGFISSLLGGAMGTLAGTNPLQSSIDQLTNAVNRLSSQMSMGGTLRATTQQGQTTGTLTFPPVNVPGVTRQAGIGGGGAGGTGNITPPAPFGRLGLGLAGGVMLGGAFAGYGQQQMPFQLGLNAYATMSMQGMGMRGMMNYQPTFSALANQIVNPLASSPMDALALAQRLQFMSGTQLFMRSAVGRAGFGAAAAFGLTNPTLSGSAAGSLAQQIYNPLLSMRMRLLGYNVTPRTMGTGMPNAIGTVASSLLQGWYGTSRVNPAQLVRTLGFGGRGFLNLQALGLNPQQMAPMLEGFNQLFNAGYSPQEASNLFTRAASRNPSIYRPAQAMLRNMGVTGVTSDIQKLRNNQLQNTQRGVNTAQGFDAALTTATDSLQRFNQALNGILSRFGLNGPLGALGGAFGVLSSTNHGNFFQGLGGLGLVGLAARMGAGSALGRAGMTAGGRGILGLGSAAGPAAIFSELAVLSHLTNTYKNQNTGPGSGIPSWMRNPANWANDIRHWGATGISTGLHWMDPFNWFGGGTSSRVGGGAAIPTSSQQRPTSRSGNIGNVSASAAKAVSAAESQLGVPYLWGGEMPGVGFDCSGLVQWAYKQAGVSLPRTSEQQWASLRKRAVALNQVREGDLVFMAGSDGTPGNPGHVGMMINNHSLIEAPFTGQDVKIIGFNPREWSHAARPSGGVGKLGTSSNLPGQNTGNSSITGLFGNTGRGMGTGFGGFGSVNEADILNAMALPGGGMTGAMLGGAPSIGGLQFPNTNSSLNRLGGRVPAGSGSRNITAEKAFAMQLLRARGWGNQFGALNSIIMAESSWRWNAANPSGAYGIPQALPGSKMSAAGSDWRTNPDTQLKWMIDMYIPQRYGTPASAWAFHQRNGWYGGGGWGGPGMRVVGDRGPEIQVDTGNGTLTINNAQTMSLLRSISQPQQTPWKNFSESQYLGKIITPGSQPNTPSKINITFSPNSINVKMTTAATDAQSAGKAFAQQVVTHMEQEVLRSTISQGFKN